MVIAFPLPFILFGSLNLEQFTLQKTDLLLNFIKELLITSKDDQCYQQPRIRTHSLSGLEKVFGSPNSTEDFLRVGLFCSWKLGFVFTNYMQYFCEIANEILLSHTGDIICLLPILNILTLKSSLKYRTSTKKHIPHGYALKIGWPSSQC